MAWVPYFLLSDLINSFGAHPALLSSASPSTPSAPSFHRHQTERQKKKEALISLAVCCRYVRVVSQRTSWLRLQDGALQRGGSSCRCGKRVRSDPGSGVVRADRTGVGWCLRLCNCMVVDEAEVRLIWEQTRQKNNNKNNIRLYLKGDKGAEVFGFQYDTIVQSGWKRTSSQVLVMMFFVAHCIVRTGTCWRKSHHHVRQIGAISASVIVQVL